MKEEMCVLPVKCKRCNTIFDLWYDLQEGDTSNRRGLAQVLRDNLCWQCRDEFVRALQGRIGFDDLESDESWSLTIESE